MSTRPLLVIGLDGADFRYLDRFSEDLPNIGQLRAAGVEAPLRSTHPPWTGSAWPSMYTGVDPSEHGVFDFFDYRGRYPDEAPVVSRNDVDAPAVWNYLTSLDRRSVVLNVPVTHPAERIDGVLVPGYLAPADEDGHPPDVRDRLSRHLGEPYRIYSAHETAESTEEKVDGFESLIRTRAAAAEYLMESEDWEFAFVQVQKTDAVFHSSSNPADFRRILAAADDLVGRVVDAVDPEPNVVVVSDHGIGPLVGQTVYVNELLREHGFVETKSNPTDLALSTVKESGPADGDGESALARAVELAKRVGFDPTTAYRLAERAGVEGLVLRLIPRSLKQSLAEGVDWRQSAAFCRRLSEQGIRLNVAGRDPAGVVPPDEYESVRTEVIELLSGLEAADGEALFELVAPREEVYRGRYSEDACDVLFRTTGMDHDVSTHFHGRTVAPADGFSHKRHGVFVASGPGIRTGWEPPELSLLDVAPLVMALLEAPVPVRMSGTVPPELLATDFETGRYEDIEFGEGTADNRDDEDEVTERLGDLGYL